MSSTFFRIHRLGTYLPIGIPKEFVSSITFCLNFNCMKETTEILISFPCWLYFFTQTSKLVVPVRRRTWCSPTECTQYLSRTNRNGWTGFIQKPILFFGSGYIQDLGKPNFSMELLRGPFSKFLKSHGSFLNKFVGKFGIFSKAWHFCSAYTPTRFNDIYVSSPFGNGPWIGVEKPWICGWRDS